MPGWTEDRIRKLKWITCIGDCADTHANTCAAATFTYIHLPTPHSIVHTSNRIRMKRNTIPIRSTCTKQTAPTRDAIHLDRCNSIGEIHLFVFTSLDLWYAVLKKISICFFFSFLSFLNSFVRLFVSSSSSSYYIFLSLTRLRSSTLGFSFCVFFLYSLRFCNETTTINKFLFFFLHSMNAYKDKNEKKNAQPAKPNRTVWLVI